MPLLGHFRPYFAIIVFEIKSSSFAVVLEYTNSSPISCMGKFSLLSAPGKPRDIVFKPSGLK